MFPVVIVLIPGLWLRPIHTIQAHAVKILSSGTPSDKYHTLIILLTICRARAIRSLVRKVGKSIKDICNLFLGPHSVKWPDAGAMKGFDVAKQRLLLAVTMSFEETLDWPEQRRVQYRPKTAFRGIDLFYWP